MACGNFVANFFKKDKCQHCMRPLSEHNSIGDAIPSLQLDVPGGAQVMPVAAELPCSGIENGTSQSGPVLFNPPCTPPAANRGAITFTVATPAADNLDVPADTDDGDHTANTLLRTPPRSPREQNPVHARPRRSSMFDPARSKRRDSRVSFLETFDMLDAALKPEETCPADVDLGLFDMFSDNAGQPCTVDNSDEARGASCTSFAMSDTDESDEDSSDDEFDFDHTKLAELVKANASPDELVQAAEQALAVSLERKLTAKASKLFEDEKLSTDNPYSDDLSGRMTPGRMTPTTDETVGAVPIEVDTLSSRMQQVKDGTQAQRRRSSVARGQTSTINEAVQEAAQRRRKSLAQAMEAMGSSDTTIEESVRQAMEGARARNRKSISKAADVLECAGYDEHGYSATETLSQMDKVAQAMEEAKRRHRRSIAKAVQGLEQPPSLLNASAGVFKPQADACEDSYTCSNTQWGHDAWAGSGSSWTGGVVSHADARINQAISSCYQQHQTYEQQQYDYHGYEQGSGLDAWGTPSGYSAWNGAHSPYSATAGQSWQQPQQYDQHAVSYGTQCASVPSTWHEPQTAYGQPVYQEQRSEWGAASAATNGYYQHAEPVGYNGHGSNVWSSSCDEQTAGAYWSSGSAAQHYPASLQNNPWRLGAA